MPVFKIELKQVDGSRESYRVFFCPGVEVSVCPLTDCEVEEYKKIGWISEDREWWLPVSEAA